MSELQMVTHNIKDLKKTILMGMGKRENKKGKEQSFRKLFNRIYV